MGIELSTRLKKFPPYLFAEIDKEKAKLRKEKIEFIDLSVGDPDILAPKKVADVLYESAKKKSNQKYALDQGKAALRKQIKIWFKKRFGVTLDENKEVLPLIGSKEGLIHLPLAFVNPGETVIIPSPGYPGYRGAALFCGAKTYDAPLLEENSFLPVLKNIPLKVRNSAKLIYLNYPNNPTTALAPRKFLEELVKFCSKYGIIIAYDNAYSEVYFDKKPLSILQIKGAKEVSVEFHSLSKTFCMTGFRIGWACGNSSLVSGLFKAKTNIDSGIFAAVQDAGIHALDKESKYVENLRKTIKSRRDYFVAGLKRLGFTHIHADSTFYVWAKIPNNKGSIAFAKELLNKRVIATPGLGFGKHGEGFIRFALTVDKAVLKKALSLLS